MRARGTQTMTRARRIRIGLAILSGLLLPASLLPGLLLLNSVNPMLHVFLVDFTVESRLDEEVRITPVGAIGSGERRPLPQYVYVGEDCAFPSLGGPSRPVAPGESITITYDWDDIQFSEILVTAEDWERMLVVDPIPSKRMFSPPARTHFVIRSKGKLTPTTDAVVRAKSRLDRELAVLIIGIVNPVAFILLVRPSRHQKAELQTSPGRTSRQ